jgi:hypothetical protein
MFEIMTQISQEYAKIGDSDYMNNMKTFLLLYYFYLFNFK